MTTSPVFKYAIAGFLGSLITNIVYDIRFANPLMRRELVLIMSETNWRYFSVFACMDFLFIMVIIGFMVYYRWKDKRKEKK